MDRLNITIDERSAGLSPTAFFAGFGIAKTKVRRLIDRHLFLVNGIAYGPDRQLASGDVVSVDLTPFEGLDFLPDDGELTILYEDESVLVVDKPSGLIIHPDNKSGRGTLVNRIAAHFVREDLDRKVGYLHRLDRETTGCLLIAKHFLAHAKLAAAWDHENVTRSYLALVSGRLREEEGTVSLALGRDRHVAGKYRVSVSGEPAVTQFCVLRHFTGYDLVSLVLLTGKTHQIRVHMSHIGHPLLGDVL
ncbi:MAG: RluA family pseudouridine synthase, partial [bacterium]